MADLNATTWFPVVTLIAGFLTKAFFDKIDFNRTLKRERENRRELRREHLAERNADFQRQTLLDLQEAVLDLIRAVGQAHHSDVMKFKESGVWQNHLLPEEIDSQLHISNRRCLMLNVRVQDNQIREMVNKFKDIANNTLFKKSDQESQASLLKMADILEPLNSRIGEVLRKLNEEEIALATKP